MHVVIAGGGVAGLEALLALRELAGHLVRITLISPTGEFVYRPVTVAEAFDRGAGAHATDRPAGRSTRSAASSCPARSRRFDVDERAIVTSGGRRIRYDALVIATGAVSRERCLAR